MAKVIHPLFSGDVRGSFGKHVIYRQGGVVTKYFVPRDPKSAAQLAQRAFFLEHYVGSLTQEQADLLYAAILHLHDDVYSPLGHGHDHGGLAGLGDDDHGQYYNQARGDARYLQSVPQQDHGGLAGLGDNDHPQYKTDYRQWFLPGGNNGTVPGSSTNYLNPYQNGIIVLAGRSIIIPVACTLSQLFFVTNGAQPAGGSLVVTVQKTGVNTALTVTVPAGGGAATRSDLTHSVSFAVGDGCTIALVNNAGTASAAVGGAAMMMVF